MTRNGLKASMYFKKSLPKTGVGRKRGKSSVSFTAVTRFWIKPVNWTTSHKGYFSPEGVSNEFPMTTCSQILAYFITSYTTLLRQIWTNRRIHVMQLKRMGKSRTKRLRMASVIMKMFESTVQTHFLVTDQIKTTRWKQRQSLYRYLAVFTCDGFTHNAP